MSNIQEQKLKMVVKMMNLAINSSNQKLANSILMDAICLVGSEADIEIKATQFILPRNFEMHKPQINYERIH